MSSEERVLKAHTVLIVLNDMFPELECYCSCTESNKIHLYFDGLEKLTSKEVSNLLKGLEAYGCETYVSVSKMQIRIG